VLCRRATMARVYKALDKGPGSLSGLTITWILTRYVYWIDVYPEVPDPYDFPTGAVVGIKYKGSCAWPGAEHFVSSPLDGIHEIYYDNIPTGKYAGYIDFRDWDHPTATIKGRSFVGVPPPEPPEPREIDLTAKHFPTCLTL
jgi:hypothetical protein